MTQISTPLRTLLTECQSAQHLPPFDSLIDSTLSSLPSSRFHFAVELEQILSSQRGEGDEHAQENEKGSLVELNEQQRSCLIHALRKIGNGFGTANTGVNKLDNYGERDEHDSHNNAFGDLLERYANGYGNGQHMNVESGRKPHAPTTNYSPLTQPAFYRPSPISLLPSISPPTTMLAEIDPIETLHFLHTSYPTLRYQWLTPLDQLNKDDSEQSSIHNELLQKAFHTPLEMEEDRLLVSTLQQQENAQGSNGGTKQKSKRSSNHKFPLSFLTPENLPQLVQHNPTIAIEVLLKLHQFASTKKINTTSARSTKSAGQSSQEHESEEALYHSALVNMDITLHTMEVVYKLATNHILHPEYLHVFVLGLFERCKNPLPVHFQSSAYGQRSGIDGNGGGTVGGGGGDRKMIRLVSVFLQNLIQNEIVQVEDFVEVQAFCIENSRVREANSLFKLLKDKRVSSSGSVSGNSNVGLVGSVGGFNIGTSGESTNGSAGRTKHSGRGGNAQRKNKKVGLRKK